MLTALSRSLASRPTTLWSCRPAVVMPVTVAEARSTVAMALYALLAGFAFSQAERQLPRAAGWLRALTAVGSGVVGVMWMVGAASGA